MFLTPLLTCTLAVASTVAPSHAADAKPRERTSGTYVVQLIDDPVATYEGGLQRLKRTAPEPGEQLNISSRPVREYVRHLTTRRNAVLDAFPGVEKLYDYDYALNGFAARLTAPQAAKLAATPGVASVTKAGITPLPVVR